MALLGERREAPRPLRIREEPSETPPATPFLVVPYYQGDRGTRPLPGSAVAWACPSLLVDGSPYHGQVVDLQSGVGLSVRVWNGGAQPTLVTARFYWSEPASGFSSTSLAGRILAATTMRVAAGATVTSPQLMGSTQDAVPEHACLLVEVTATQDPAPGTFDAAADRHYGQQNIHVLTAMPARATRFTFLVPNARDHEERYTLVVRPVEDEAGVLRRLLGLRRIRMPHAVLLRLPGREAGSGFEGVEVLLRGGEVVKGVAEVEVGDDLQPGEGVVVDLVQLRGRRGEPVGALGAVIVPEGG